MDTNAKVAYFEHQPSGCYWYRTKHPMDAFTRAGIKTTQVGLNKDIENYDGLKAFQIYGIYPFSFAEVLQTIKKDGKKLVYDLDDALDLIEKTNPFYYAVKKDSNSAKEIFEHIDHVTVSTPKMAEYARARTNKPITVIPNCFDKKDWTFTRPKREGFRIGFAGSATHVPDLIKIIPVIKKLQEEGDVRFLIMGFGKETYERWYNDFKYVAPMEGIAELRELNELMKTIKFEWVPYVDFSIYPQVLTNMALDIGLCPLNNTDFNNHRSPCKAMEYTLSGALAIASDVIPYNTEPTSVLVKDDKWEETIRWAMDNPLEREYFRQEHLKWLEENRNVDNIVPLLKEVYMV